MVLTHSSDTRRVAQWSAFLVALYLGMSAVGWERTLIDDEIWALHNATLSFPDHIDTIRQDLVHPPLMNLLVRGWFRVFGAGDDAAKALVLGVNAVTITLFTVFAASVVPQWRLASFLFTTAYLQIGGVPTLVRDYSLGLLLVVASALAYEAWRRDARLPQLARWTAIMLLLVYTHYVGGLLVAAYFLLNAIRGTRRTLFSGAVALVGLAFVPWVLFLLPVYLSRGLEANTAWIDDRPIVVLAKLPFYFLSYLPAGFNPLGANDWPTGSMPRLLLMVAAAGLHAVLLVRAVPRVMAASRTGERAPGWLVETSVLAAVPITAIILASYLIRPFFDARYAAFVLPMYWIGIVTLARLAGTPGQWILRAVVVPWVLVSVAVPALQHLTTPLLRDGVRRLAAASDSGDLILSERVAGRQMSWEWHYGIGRFEPVVMVTADRRQYEAALEIKPLDEVHPPDGGRVWVVSSRFNLRASEAIFQALRARGFTEGDTFHHGFTFHQFVPTASLTCAGCGVAR